MRAKQKHPRLPKTLLQSNANTQYRPGEIRTKRNALNSEIPLPVTTLSETEALYQLTAIPLYFPASYSLVKPYVQGFEPNGLDILMLKDVRIDNNWQPKRPDPES